MADHVRAGAAIRCHRTRRIHVLREPGADGYRDSVIATGEQRIACQALPALELAVREAFPAPVPDLPPR